MNNCPKVQAEIGTTTGLKRENTLRQFNYTYPIGMNIMGNWVPFTFLVLMTPTSGYEAILEPVPDSHNWFYCENQDEYVCRSIIGGWNYFYAMVQRKCDEYIDKGGSVHKPMFKKLVDGPTDLMEIETRRHVYSGQRYYQASDLLLADGAICRPLCAGGFNDNYTPYWSKEAETEKANRAPGADKAEVAIPTAVVSKTETSQTTTSFDTPVVARINRVIKRSDCSTCGRR